VILKLKKKTPRNLTRQDEIIKVDFSQKEQDITKVVIPKKKQMPFIEQGMKCYQTARSGIARSSKEIKGD
jgi:hypothetical protein